MKSWWRQRAARERWVLLAGAGFVSAALLWALVWLPLGQARQALRRDVAQAQADLQWMSQVADGLRARQARGQGSGLERAGRSLLALADSGAREAGLGALLKRAEPAGEGRVSLWFEGVPFDPLCTWLEGLEERFAIHIEEFSVERAQDPGNVNARLTLVDPT